jgi:hypothetical protein
MNTESLIRTLASQASRPLVGIRVLMGAALGAGAAVSLLLFRAFFEPRADLALAIQGHAFATKLAVVVLLAVTAGGLLAPVARPYPVRVARRLGLAPMLLAVAVIVELVANPAHSWSTRVLGRDVLHCLGAIPLLSLPPALCLFAALRRGAPANAARAGAIAGLAAAGIGARLYALACPRDSSLFVAIWYSLAIGAVTAAGAFAGRRWLRW